MSDTAFLELADGSVAMVDGIDLARVANVDWQSPLTGDGYVMGLDFYDGPCPDLVFLHRLIANAGPDEIVLHRNGNTLDNRRENLAVQARLRAPLPAALERLDLEPAFAAD